MKRKQFAALCLALLLAACTAAPKAAQSGSAAPQSMPAAREEETPVSGGPDLRLVPEANFCDSDGNVLLLFRRGKEKIDYGERYVSALACIVDCETGESRPLCQKEGCLHRDETCPAWADWTTEGFLSKLAVTDHYYVLAFDRDTRFGARFFPKDGGEPIVVTLEKTQEEYEWGTADSRLIVAGDTLYRELTYLPDKPSKGFRLTTEGIEPCQWTEENEWIAGVNGRELLLSYSATIRSSRETLEAWRAELENQKTKYYFRNIDTGEMRLLAEITGPHNSNAGQYAFYWTSQREGKGGSAVDYETGIQYSLPEGWELHLISPFVDADGKFPLRNEAGELIAIDYKTGTMQPFSRQKETFNEMGFFDGKMLIWDSATDRWGLWDVADYRENKGEPAWFDFSACDAYLAQ